MKTPIRLDNALVQEAELQGRTYKRTAPNQIEYWAELGRAVEDLLDPNDLVAIRQGFARLRIEPLASNPLDVAEVTAAVDKLRRSNKSSAQLSGAKFYYEASPNQPGMLDRVDDKNQRETGYFKDGRFVQTKQAKKKKR